VGEGGGVVKKKEPVAKFSWWGGQWVLADKSQ
jgi:hypothetical protein